MPGLLDSLLGGLREALSGPAAVAAFGSCGTCNRPALPIACSVCGGQTCLEHAFVSGASVTRRELPVVLCQECVSRIPAPGGGRRRRRGESGAQWQRDPRPANVEAERRAWARKILGVDAKATKDEIRKAYRQLAQKYHPDHNPGDAVAEAAFKQVAEAYRILMGPKRAKEAQ